MKLSCTIRELHPRHVFRIARPRKNAIRNVYVRLEHAGTTGFGEASPNAYYAETAELVRARLEGARSLIETLAPASVPEIAAASEAAWPLLQPSRAAQCALDLALWDWLARARGVSVAELAWGAPPQAVETFCTLGLSTPAELAVKLPELRGCPLIKVKADAQADLATIRRVREELPGALVAVDANASWSLAALPQLTAELAATGVAFLEQPLPPAENVSLQRGAFPLPIMADESCVREEDVEPVAAHFDGFNIKLVKCGGLSPALRMWRRGRELGRRVMVGCMLESSLLIAAGAVLGQRTDFADLDGAWLLADDPFHGLPFQQGCLLPAADQPGFGVRPEPGLF